MSKKGGKARNSRDAPQKRGATVGIVSTESAWLSICGDGYKPLTSCPEVQMCAGVYADLISTMTLHLMHSTTASFMTMSMLAQATPTVRLLTA